MYNDFAAAIETAIKNSSEICVIVGCKGVSCISIRFVPEFAVINGNEYTIYYNEDQHIIVPLNEVTYDEIEDGYCVYDEGMSLLFAI